MPLHKILGVFLFVKNDIGISIGIVEYFGSWLKRIIPIMDRGHSDEDGLWCLELTYIWENEKVEPGYSCSACVIKVELCFTVHSGQHLVAVCVQTYRVRDGGGCKKLSRLKCSGDHFMKKLKKKL